MPAPCKRRKIDHSVGSNNNSTLRETFRSFDPDVAGPSTSQDDVIEKLIEDQEPEIESIDYQILADTETSSPNPNEAELLSNKITITRRDLSESIWGPPKGSHLEFEKNYVSGVGQEWTAALMGELPLQFYLALVNFEIIDEIVDQTNLYATQFLLESTSLTNSARVHAWEPTTRKEMLHFLGLLGYMGIVRMNSLRNYWSTKWLYKNDVAPKIMSRNRFELLLKMLHFSNNQECPEGDRLHKIQPLLNKLIKNFQEIYTPDNTFCIDETLVPFQGRLYIKQYIPQKAHKYGIKVFKLCCDNGYTWNLSIYAGQEKGSEVTVPTSIVLNLAQGLLGSGRTCVTDNYYTSPELANILLDNKTHCIGTLRKNRKGNPKDVIEKKLKKR